MLVAGVDSSTQSTKVLLCQAEDGTVVGQATAAHPDGTEADPQLWWRALGEAGHGLLDRADAIRAAGHRTHRRARRPSRMGAPYRERPDGVVHGDQATLAGRS